MSPTEILAVLAAVAVGAFGTHLSVLAARRFIRGSPSRQVVAGWLIWVLASGVACWLLFAKADAELAQSGDRNVGTALVYFFLWIMSAFVGPAFARIAAAVWANR